MRPEEYLAFDATGLAALVRRGEISAATLAEAAIQRIDALNPQLNAVVETAYDQARLAARSADTQGTAHIGEPAALVWMTAAAMPCY
jgi:amidase